MMFENSIYYIHESANTQNVSTGDKSSLVSLRGIELQKQYPSTVPTRKAATFYSSLPKCEKVAIGLLARKEYTICRSLRQTETYALGYQ